MLFIIIISHTEAQNWILSADAVQGETAGDNFGYSVSFNDSGTVFAAGVPANSENGTEAGQVKVYEFLGDTWMQIGLALNGEATGDNFGYSVSLNSDGSVLAAGAMYNDGSSKNAGHARVFQNVSGTWVQIGSDIDGEAADDNSGVSVSLNSAGNIVAVGAFRNDGSGNKAGQVRVFENVAGEWVQIGSDIDGENAGDLSGLSVSLNAAGNIVAVGAPNNSGSYTSAGQARVFENIAGAWVQIGSDIDGEAANDRSGYALSLDASGNRLAVGAYLNGGTVAQGGQIRVFENIAGAWVQIGSDVDGQNSQDNLGISVSLSPDGNTFIAGATGNATNGTLAGMVRVFQLDTGEWIQKGDDIYGESSGNFFGNSVGINFNGSLIIAGAPYNDSGGTDAGLAETYYLCIPSTDPVPNVLILPEISGECSAEIIDSPSAVDECGNLVNGATSDPLFYDELGTFTITWLYEDSQGNTSTQFQTVYIVDTTQPLITSSHPDISVTADSNCFSLLRDYTVDLTAIDNCDSLLDVIQSPLPGTMISGSTNIVILTVSDDSGNSNTIEFNVEVNDEIDPIINSVHDDVVLIAGNNCESFLPDYTGSVVAFDNCDDTLTVIQTPQAGTVITGSVNLIRLTVFDSSVNSAYVEFNAEVIDESSPVINSIHVDQILTAGDDCSALLPDYTLNVIASDNCDTNLDIFQTPIPGAEIFGTVNIIELTAVDDSGNSNSVQFNVDVIDNTSPVIETVPDDQFLNADSNCEAILPDFKNEITASDNCDNDLEFVQSPAPGTIINGTINTVSITAVDDSGNSDIAFFHVSVIDNTIPVITSEHTDVDLNADSNCKALLPDFRGDVITEDNCDQNPVITQIPLPGTIMSGLDNLITLHVEDDAGNFVETSFYIDVVDTSKPYFLIDLDDQEIDADQNCEALLPDFRDNVTIHDNCTEYPVIEQFPLPGTLITGSENDVHLMILDDAGNSDELVFNANVTDNSIPVIECNSNIEVFADESGYFNVKENEIDFLEISDNCEIDQIINSYNNSNTLDGEQIPFGEYLVTWEVTDKTGNTGTCDCELVINEFNGFILFPNPAGNTLNLIGPRINSAVVEVIDINGKIFAQKKLTEINGFLDLSGYGIGVLFVRFITDNDVYTYKIIKQ